MVTFIWRAAGLPEPVYEGSQFADVNTDLYYGKAVLWAAEQGIVKGITDTEFGPALDCTRAQIVTFLYRYYEPLVR